MKTLRSVRLDQPEKIEEIRGKLQAARIPFQEIRRGHVQVFQVEGIYLYQAVTVLGGKGRDYGRNLENGGVDESPNQS